MLLYAKKYRPQAIATILCPYVLKSFAEQLDVLKVDDDNIIPMDKFAGTTTNIFL